MSVLEPIVKFVGRLSFRNKLRGTALMFGGPLLFIAGILFFALNARVTALQLEREALAVQVPANTLMANLHQYIAARQGTEAGAEQLAELATTKRIDTQNALTTLRAAFAGNTFPVDTRPDVTHWLRKWDDLAKTIDTASVAELHDLTRSLRAELDKVNEDTGLLLDGDASSSRLLEVLTNHLPGLLDATGHAAQLGTTTLISKSIRGSKRNDLTLLRGNFNAYVQWSIDRLQKVGREHGSMAAELEEASSQLNTAYLGLQEALTTKMLDTLDFDMAPEMFLGITGKAFSDSLAVSRVLQTNADILLGQRLTNLQAQRNVVFALIVVGLLLVTAGFIAAYISIMRGLNGLSDAVNVMASGDLGARVNITTRDELGDVGAQFNLMAEKLAVSNEQLHEKTNDIHNMLQNMPQGILTIVEGGKIHPEYSAYIETIFETNEVSDKSALQFVFDNTSASADIISQVEAALAACIGEDRMNYEFNAHLLVNEIAKTMPDGRIKYLELNWSPICDDNDIVEKVMLCVWDETELKQLEAEAQHQKQELEMIGQILKINQEKFHEFIDSSRKFILENKSLLEAAKDKHPELITQLFRNMHTIKGNARTYGLLHLTNVVHEAEQAYDELRKNNDAYFDKSSLLAQLDGVSGKLEEFATLNEVTLGRKGPGRRGSAEKYVMVERAQIDQLASDLDAYDLQAAHKETLAAALQQVKFDLRLIGTEYLQNILTGVVDSLPSLARELGKEPPRVVIADNGIRIRNQASDLLGNVFMHLYRNSMDHGIETGNERVANGKPAAGTIRLDLTMADNAMRLSLKDDGKGLAIGYIRRKAMEKGLIAEGQPMSDEDVAALIFAAGFSTAAAVTEVSGRGVGMDAVKNFIKREGGSIQLVFTDTQQGADFRAFETVIVMPSHLAVDMARGTAKAKDADTPRIHADGKQSKGGSLYDSLLGLPSRVAAV